MIELTCILKDTEIKCVIKLKKRIWENIQQGGYYEKVNSFHSNDIKYVTKWIFKEGIVKITKARSQIEYLYDDSISTLLLNF